MLCSLSTSFFARTFSQRELSITQAISDRGLGCPTLLEQLANVVEVVFVIISLPYFRPVLLYKINRSVSYLSISGIVPGTWRQVWATRGLLYFSAVDFVNWMSFTLVSSSPANCDKSCSLHSAENG